MGMRGGRLGRLIYRARRLGVRWIFYSASAALAVLALYTVSLAVRADWHSAQVARLSIVWALLGMTWAATGIISNALTIRIARGGPRISRRELLEPRLTQSDAFVDRAQETKELIEAILIHKVTNLHGRKGSGKSHFLSFVNDVANGHRHTRKRDDPFHRLRPFKIIYFDLSEALGFDDVVKLLFQANFPDQSPSWEQFTKNVEALFGSRPVVLILDNVNSEALWRQLGKALYHYLSRRHFDRIVIGSIRAVRFHNLQVHWLAFGGFDNAAIEELALANDIVLHEEQLARLRDSSDGLPIFLRLLFSHWGSHVATPAGLTSDVRALLRETILPLLGPAATELLVGIALLMVVDPEATDAELARLPVTDIAESLDTLEAFSLVRVRSRGRSKFVKLHDLVRDAVLELCGERAPPLAEALAISASHGGALNEAALFWLYAAPLGFDSQEPYDTIGQAVLRAVAAKDYPLLITISLLTAARPELKRLTLTEPRLAGALVYASASARAGVGKYADALAVLDASGLSVLRKVAAKPDELTNMEFEIAYLLADLSHLQNHYDEALTSFGLLLTAASTPRFADRAGRIEWAVGHVLRHQGRDFDAALAHFDAALALAQADNDIATQVFSITGRLGIQIHLGRLPESARDDLDLLEEALTRHPGLNNYLPKIWKCRAQIESLAGNFSQAASLIERAIAQAVAMNDRLMFNYYFERGEILRAAGRHAAAIEDYVRVLEYGRENGDRNLVANALLGISEAEISRGGPLHRRDEAGMRENVLTARAIAEDADIFATKQQAELTLSRLEGRHDRPARLVLF